MRAKVLRLLVAVVVAGAALLVGAPAHAANMLDGHQWNMCGNPCNTGPGNWARPVDTLSYVEAVSSPRPAFITLNEVCSNQYLELVQNRGFNQNAGGRGFAAYFQPLRTGGLPADCGSQYGNVIFVRGVPQGPAFGIPFVDQDLSGTYPSTQRIDCRRSLIFSFNFVTCVTHTDASGSHPTMQSQEAYTFAQLYAGDRRYVGGDFNTSSPRSWPTTYWDADAGFSLPTFSTNPSSSLSRKIDFIYADKAHQNTIPTGGPSCNTWPASDHCYFVGHFDTL